MWHSAEIINKELIKCKYFTVTLRIRSKNSIMGRFGGGWNWKLGLQAGERTLIISLLVLDVRIDITKGKPS